MSKNFVTLKDLLNSSEDFVIIFLPFIPSKNVAKLHHMPDSILVT